MTCSSRGRRRADSTPKREPVKRYVHPICPAVSTPAACQTLEAILLALERQNALLEAICRSQGGQG